MSADIFNSLSSKSMIRQLTCVMLIHIWSISWIKVKYYVDKDCSFQSLNAKISNSYNNLIFKQCCCLVCTLCCQSALPSDHSPPPAPLTMASLASARSPGDWRHLNPNKAQIFSRLPSEYNARANKSKSKHISASFTCHNHKRFAPVLLTCSRAASVLSWGVVFHHLLLLSSLKIFIVNTRLLRAQPNPDYLNSFVQT